MHRTANFESEDCHDPTRSQSYSRRLGARCRRAPRRSYPARLYGAARGSSGQSIRRGHPGRGPAGAGSERDNGDGAVDAATASALDMLDPGEHVRRKRPCHQRGLRRARRALRTSRRQERRRRCRPREHNDRRGGRLQSLRRDRSADAQSTVESGARSADAGDRGRRRHGRENRRGLAGCDQREVAARPRHRPAQRRDRPAQRIRNVDRERGADLRRTAQGSQRERRHAGRDLPWRQVRVGRARDRNGVAVGSILDADNASPGDARSAQ